MLDGLFAQALDLRRNGFRLEERVLDHPGEGPVVDAHRSIIAQTGSGASAGQWREPTEVIRRMSDGAAAAAREAGRADPQAGSLTVTDNRTGRTYQIPIVDGM